MIELKKIPEKMISLWIKPIISFAKSKNHIEYVLNIICKSAESEKYFPSFRMRDKNTSNIPLLDICPAPKDELGIILQGPIVVKDDMTINSIKYYKKIYPRAVIILSVWEDEDSNAIELCRKEGAFIVQSKKPDTPGVLNINYQIISSRNGIIKAIDLGAKYIAKTRSDQRVCKPWVLHSLVSMLQKCTISSAATNMKNRIVVMPTYVNNMFTPYFMSDFFYFGNASDMLNLFSVQLDTRKGIDKSTYLTRRDYAESMYPPEIYLLLNFLRTYAKHDIQATIKDYWYCIEHYLVCIDKNMLDLLVTKYNYSHNDGTSEGTYFSYDTEERKLTMKWGFIEWNNLVSGYCQYDTSYEKEADIPF